MGMVIEEFALLKGFEMLNSILCHNTDPIVLYRVLQLFKHIICVCFYTRNQSLLVKFNQFPLFVMYTNRLYSKILESQNSKTKIDCLLHLKTENNSFEINEACTKLLLECLSMLLDLQSDSNICIEKLNENFCNQVMINYRSSNPQVSYLASEVLEILLSNVFILP